MVGELDALDAGQGDRPAPAGYRGDPAAGGDGEPGPRPADYGGVAATTTDKHRRAAPDCQGIVQRIADNRAARAVGRARSRTTRQLQPLDIGTEHIVVEIGINRVRSFAGVLDHDITRLGHLVPVVAGSTCHGVVTGPAQENVAPCIPDQGVVPRIAGPDPGRPGQGQVLDIVRESIGVDVGEDRVGALAGQFRNHVARLGNLIDVIPASTDHGVVSGAAVQRVVAVKALQSVVPAQPINGVVTRRAHQRLATGCPIDCRGRRAQHDHPVGELELFHIGQRVDAGAPVVARDRRDAVGGRDGIGRGRGVVEGGVRPRSAVDGVVPAAGVGGVRRIALIEAVVAGLAEQRRSGVDDRHDRMSRHRHVERIGSARRDRVHDQCGGSGNPLGYLNIVDPVGGRDERQGRVRLVSAVARPRGAVIIFGQHIAGGIENAHDAVERGVVDIDRDRRAGRGREAVPFEVAASGRCDGGVRRTARVRDIGPRHDVEAAVQRNRGRLAGVGRRLVLDDVRCAATFAARTAVEAVVPAAAVDGIHAAAAAEDVVAAVPGQGVVIGGAADVLDPGQRIGARAAAGGSCGEVNDDGRRGADVAGKVDACAAVQAVIAEPSDERVVSIPAGHGVVADPAIQRVVAVQPVDGVIPAAARNRVCQGGAGDRLVRQVARNIQAAGRRRRNRLVGELQEFDIGDGDVLAVADDQPGLPVPGDGIG